MPTSVSMNDKQPVDSVMITYEQKVPLAVHPAHPDLDRYDLVCCVTSGDIQYVHVIYGTSGGDRPSYCKDEFHKPTAYIFRPKGSTYIFNEHIKPIVLRA